jgi:hypothetical protein
MINEIMLGLTAKEIGKIISFLEEQHDIELIKKLKQFNKRYNGPISKEDYEDET